MSACVLIWIPDWSAIPTTQSLRSRETSPSFDTLTSMCQSTESGKGGNMIQGSISLDNKTTRNRTEIVPGFLRATDRWLTTVEIEEHSKPKAKKHGRSIHSLEKTWTSEPAKIHIASIAPTASIAPIVTDLDDPASWGPDITMKHARWPESSKNPILCYQLCHYFCSPRHIMVAKLGEISQTSICWT